MAYTLTNGTRSSGGCWPSCAREWVIPVTYAWMKMEEKNEDLEHQLDSIRLKEKEKPKDLLQKLEHAVEEGANVKSLFHTRTKNCF